MHGQIKKLDRKPIYDVTSITNQYSSGFRHFLSLYFPHSNRNIEVLNETKTNDENGVPKTMVHLTEIWAAFLTV